MILARETLGRQYLETELAMILQRPGALSFAPTAGPTIRQSLTDTCVWTRATGHPPLPQHGTVICRTGVECRTDRPRPWFCAGPPQPCVNIMPLVNIRVILLTWVG